MSNASGARTVKRQPLDRLLLNAGWHVPNPLPPKPHPRTSGPTQPSGGRPWEAGGHPARPSLVDIFNGSVGCVRANPDPPWD